MHHNPMMCPECRAAMLEIGFLTFLAAVLVAIAWSAF